MSEDKWSQIKEFFQFSNIEFLQGGRVFVWNGLHLVTVFTKSKQYLGLFTVGDWSRPKAELDDVHAAIEQYIKVNGRSI